MNLSFRGKTILFLGFLSFFTYQLLLGNKGYLEREELRKTLEGAKFELEKTTEENKNLRERKKINLDESRLLEKEARKYYLMRSDSHILKFWEENMSNESEDRDKKNFWNRLTEDGLSGEKIPPLDVLRVFHISFSIFLLILVYWKLGQISYEIEESDGSDSIKPESENSETMEGGDDPKPELNKPKEWLKSNE